MKKYFILSVVITTAFIFSNCSGPKKATASKPPAPTYETNLQPLILAHCSPCHIPSKGGFKKAYDNYAAVKGDIDEIIRRIELNPGERGFMPFKKTEKLNDSTIAVFKQWKESGMGEK